VNRLRGQLPALQAALSVPIPPAPAPVANPADVDPFIRAIARKATFADMHLTLLTAIDWDQVDRIGRRVGGGTAPANLVIQLADASLTIDHPGALIDHVYVAFDGITAAVVNMSDTLGRLINHVYSLGIPDRQASLFAVRDQCAPASPLGQVLTNAAHTEWLKKVRDLRGRCQHADVEEVLTSNAGPYARRGQPAIDQNYCWSVPPVQMPIATFVREAVDAADNALTAVVGAILAAPQNPTV
jgi:hypothetical protein